MITTRELILAASIFGAAAILQGAILLQVGIKAYRQWRNARRRDYFPVR